MNSAQILQPVEERGWRQGLANLLRKENGRWWHTQRWWIQGLLWTLIINGTLAVGLWIVPLIEPDLRLTTTKGFEFFVQMMAWFPMFAVIVITQGAIIDEKQSGTAAWILSTPVSRESFILAKLFANAFGFLVTVILLQGILAYIQLSLYGDNLLPVGPYLVVMALFCLYLFFYLTLTLMLGSFFNSRGPVLAVAIAVAIASMRGAGQLLSGYAPWIVEVLPEALPLTAYRNVVGISAPSDGLIPVVFVSAYSLLFVALAIWRFKREEF